MLTLANESVKPHQWTQINACYSTCPSRHMQPNSPGVMMEGGHIRVYGSGLNDTSAHHAGTEPGDEAKLVEVGSHCNQRSKPGEGVPGSVVVEALLPGCNTYVCVWLVACGRACSAASGEEREKGLRGKKKRNAAGWWYLTS